MTQPVTFEDFLALQAKLDAEPYRPWTISIPAEYVAAFEKTFGKHRPVDK